MDVISVLTNLHVKLVQLDSTEMEMIVLNALMTVLNVVQQITASNALWAIKRSVILENVHQNQPVKKVVLSINPLIINAIKLEMATISIVRGLNLVQMLILAV